MPNTPERDVVETKKSREEILAYLSRKEQALKDPDFFGRFWTELADGCALDFNINADHDAEVEIVLQAGAVTVFAKMMLDEARSVHEKLGKAIAERQEEVDHFGG